MGRESSGGEELTKSQNLINLGCPNFFLVDSQELMSLFLV